MIRVNLLPYREEAKKARRQQFFALTGMVAVLGALIVFFLYSIIEGYIANQDGRNDYLKQKIVALDKDIDQIKRLKEQTQALLARKQIIESLQRDRGETVRLMNELVKQVPEGVYLKSIKQDGLKVNLVGLAQSSARVSTMMRNIDGSQWLANPQLMEIKAVSVDKRRLNEFVMNLELKRPKVEDAGGSAASGAKK